MKIVAICICLIHVVTCIRYYVNPSSSYLDGENDGLSWDSSFISIEQVLDVLPSTGAHQIWLKGNEIYTPNTTNRSQCFIIPRGIKIYGGFEGAEESLEERPEIATFKYGRYSSVISGDIGIKNDNSDNCYHVISYDRLLSIDRVIISDGNANYNQPDYHINQINTLHRYGGGIITIDSTRKTELSLREVSFINNQAFNGGAMWFASNPNTPVNVSIVDCLFENNTAFDIDGSYGGGYGGSIYFYHLAVINIINSDFIGNYAQNRGLYHQNQLLVISNVVSRY